MEKFEFKGRLFGANIEIVVYVGKVDEKIVEDSYKEGVRLEKIFNFYDSESELSQLNKKRKMKVSKEFLEVLELAIKMSKKTNGFYDVTLGKNFKERKEGKDLSFVKGSYKDIKITKDEVEINQKDLLIDFGSIAKGYITDKIGDFLKKKKVKKFAINSRGDILICGQIHNLDIAHPRNKEKSIGTVQVENGGIATSGDYNQYHKDYEHSHIIGGKKYSSVTVVAPTLTEADIYATVFSLISENEMEKILRENKELKVLTVTKNLKMKKYNGFEEIFSEKKPEIDEMFNDKTLENGEEYDSEEWFVGDGPLNENTREIFVRPGKKEDSEFVTKAS